LILVNEDGISNSGNGADAADDDGSNLQEEGGYEREVCNHKFTTELMEKGKDSEDWIITSTCTV
jgi:hypothetical protein